MPGRKALGWEPKVDVKALARMMVDFDLRQAEREKVLRAAGHDVAAREGFR